ncbi:hypothetical protein SAMN04487911_10133 [Arenibacter nanhaiticus]|uniref:Uncharacterized protein n=1 Tax=Arenibacter nanhaiticus TaxID=558155 RepID=A0A1M6A1D6_9FLAO|nr:hypothetical protein [Arenibacter nanhaiticus]SHI30314.1 hypothetical protein SAMN04487911_10133 [Arenibacter nanhaiticus]
MNRKKVISNQQLPFGCGTTSEYDFLPNAEAIKDRHLISLVRLFGFLKADAEA